VSVTPCRDPGTTSRMIPHQPGACRAARGLRTGGGSSIPRATHGTAGRWTRIATGLGLALLAAGCAVAPGEIVRHLDGSYLQLESGGVAARSGAGRCARIEALAPADRAIAYEIWGGECAPTDPARVAQRNAPDLWTRVRAGFALPAPDLPAVRAQMNWFVRNPDYLDRTVRRARPYLYHIVERVEARGLPSEIALLPVIESAFQPFARSPAEAVGLWQFIPATGRRFGLLQVGSYDGRKDVFASTDAALDYLASLHQQFKGDWLLALAAYNWGEGNVARSVQESARLGRPASFWNLSLPEETRTYVPRLLALARVVGKPEAYGLQLAGIPNSPYLTRVPIDRPIDLKSAAEIAGIPLDDLRHLNPASPALVAPPHLVLPIHRANAFLARFRDA